MSVFGCDVFFFNDTATTEIYTLSLHDALPIWDGAGRDGAGRDGAGRDGAGRDGAGRDSAGREERTHDFNVASRLYGVGERAQERRPYSWQ